MDIKPLKAFRDNYIWLILNDEPFFDCVDPGEAQPVLDFIQQTGLHLRNIYLTHHHQDHQGGVKALKERFNEVTVFGPADDRILILDQAVGDNDTITGHGYELYVLETPGHTSTHLCYLDKTHSSLFCGDTLFSAGCGRVFDGSHHELYQSLMRLKTLDDKTKVYCAHEYTLNNLDFAKTIEPENQRIDEYRQSIMNKSCSLPSNIKLEKEVNPFLRLNQPAVMEFARQHQIDPKEPYQVFRLLRDLKDSF